MIGLCGFSHRQTVCHRMSIPSRDSLSETDRITSITPQTTYNCRSHWQKQGRWWFLLQTSPFPNRGPAEITDSESIWCDIAVLLQKGTNRRCRLRLRLADIKGNTNTFFATTNLNCFVRQVTGEDNNLANFWNNFVIRSL